MKTYLINNTNDMIKLLLINNMIKLVSTNNYIQQQGEPKAEGTSKILCEPYVPHLDTQRISTKVNYWKQRLLLHKNNPSFSLTEEGNFSVCLTQCTDDLSVSPSHHHPASYPPQLPLQPPSFTNRLWLAPDYSHTSV